MIPSAAQTRPGAEPPSLFWVDALRVAAAAAVVFLHVAAEPVVFVKIRSLPVWWIGNAIDSSVRWCVPVFVMLSGALLLPRRDEPTRVFLTRRVRRIAVPLAAWSAAYIGFRAWHRGMPDWEWIGDHLLRGVPEYHMWYVYMTLGLYLLTPPLRRFVASADRRLLLGTCAVLLALAAVHDALFSFGYLPMFRSVFTMYIPFLGYYLAGCALVRHPPRIPSAALAAVVAACIATIALGTRPLMDHYGVIPAGLYLYEYLSPPVIAMSLSVFVLGSRMPALAPDGRMARWVRDASGATLGIYLIHVMLIHLLRDQGLATVPLGVVGVPVVATTTLLLCYALVSVLRRLPLLRQCV